MQKLFGSRKAHCLISMVASLSALACGLPVFADGGMTWKMVNIKEDKKKPLYTVEVSYPKFSGKPEQAAAVTTLNKVVSDAFLKVVADSKKDFATAKPVSADAGSDLSCEPEIALATPDVVSMNMSYEVFVAGCAHPSHITQVVNYQMNPPGKLTLDQLFKKDSGYLQKLSAICAKQLKTDMGEDADMSMIKSGTKPTAANFKNFTLHKDALEILFGEYQVGPYVAGPQSVSVPWKTIKPLLATESVASKLAGIK